MKNVVLVVSLVALVLSLVGMGQCESTRVYTYNQKYSQYQPVIKGYNVRTTVTKQVTERLVPYCPAYCCPAPACYYSPPQSPYCNPYQTNCYSPPRIHRGLGCPVLNLCTIPFTILDSLFGGQDYGYYPYR